MHQPAIESVAFKYRTVISHKCIPLDQISDNLETILPNGQLEGRDAAPTTLGMWVGSVGFDQ
jgi:hypothetical protein